MAYSWYLSYPLSIDSLDDFVFNHVSVLYWFSLSLLLASMYMMAVTFKNDYLRWIMSVGIVMALYSISYFYYMLPGSDSLLFRGMHEYFMRTKNLDFSQPGKAYFQWPSIFILSDIATSVSGLELANFEFLMYAIIGFLLATTLYVFASKAYRNGGFLAVVIFFIAMFRYLNYQFVPFTIALILLFLLFILDTRRRSSSVTLAMLVLFMGVTITHVFVPLFFVIFLLTRWIINRNKKYGKFFLLNLTIWLVFQVTFAGVGFTRNIWAIMNLSTEVSVSAMVTVNPVSVPIDVIAQKLSMAILIASVTICVAGFAILLIKRRMRDIDKAIFLFAAGYYGLGIMLYVLGSRTIPIAFIPFSLGAAYLFESRFRPYLKAIFLVLLILSSSIPLHSTFSKNDVMFQTREAYIAENFFIDHYNWTNYHLVFANYRVVNYLESKLTDYAHLTWRFKMINETDTIFYTVGLGLYLSRYNYTIKRVISEERLNVLYNNGFSILGIKVET
jgi:hypothetical protein